MMRLLSAIETAHLRDNERRTRPVPLLTAVVCARDRPDRLRRALASIAAQTLTDWEVVVVNHGALEVPDDVTADERFLVIPIGPQPAGAARATALANARTPYLAFCDDLDIWTPDHLATLMAEIQRDPTVGLVHGAAVWGDLEGNPVEAPDVEPWPGAAQTPFLAPSSVLVRTDAARSVGGFDAYLNAFAEWDLALRLSDWWGIRHVGAVVTNATADPLRDELAPSFVHDRARVVRHVFARRIRFPHHRAARPARRVPPRFDPATWSDGRRELDLASIWSGKHSYASVNKGLLPALAGEGISLHLRNARELPPDLRQYGPSDGSAGRMLFFYEVGSRPRDHAIEPLIQYTMYELDFIPRVHVEEINNYVSLLLVPCAQNRQAFLAAGVTVPTKILHHGIDPVAFPLLDRGRPGERDVFTFGTFGQQNERKGVDVLLRAFRDEFSPEEPVRLILNATITDAWLRQEESRIEIRTGFLDHAGLLEYLRELDAFVLPSRGEGFGLCGLEAMATGLPTIATNWSGPADYLDPVDSFPLEYRLTEMAGREFGTSRLFGRWAEPSYEHLRSLMRRLYEHPAEARAFGERASARIHREWTWDRAARHLVADLDRLASGVSPAVDEPGMVRVG